MAIVYQNYHRHSCYTNTKVSDSTATNKEYAERAVSLGHGILSSMEHGYQGNYFETVKLAKQYGLKPVIGAEAYWVKDRFEKDGTNCHIYIGAKNENGRMALNDVLSEANITGFYRRARVDVPLLLSLPANDMIVTSACLAGWEYEDAEEIMIELWKHFGKNFFLEVQYHNTEDQLNVNKRILRLHEEYKIPLIMGTDSHYIFPEQKQDRANYIASKRQKEPEMDDEYMLDYPSGDEAYNRFSKQALLTHQQIMDAIDNTNVFLDVGEYDQDVFGTDIKKVTIYPEKTMEERNKIYENLIWTAWDEYKKQVPQEQHAHYESEIQKEVSEVEACDMADYFILNHAIIKRGKENGGWITKSGRGSAVSFFTNMLLGFTEVDRIAAKITMYPERFLTSTRILQSATLPDIDFNLAQIPPFATAQKEILGDDHAYPMLSYGTMKTSAAWKLYSKSQGIPFEIANEVSQRIQKYEKALKHADEDEVDSIDIVKYIGKEYLDLYNRSSAYLGIVDSWSIAPCAYLLYQNSIRKKIGLIKIKDNLCCMMDGHAAEECHYLKNDLLKVNVVEAIYKMFHAIGKEPPSVTELINMCTPDDVVWDVYKRGCCLGINQVEKEGTAARVGKYAPKNITELAAFVAAIRPGAASIYKAFEGRETFNYGVKAFDDLIQTPEIPNSFVLYQEQEMKVLNFAGISMSETYTAIKNIAKKRAEKVLAYKEIFEKGFKAAIMAEGKSDAEAAEITEKLWKLIEDSSSYSFNSSHSYCVALDSLYCAYLKSHYPMAFYQEYIKIQEAKGDKDKVTAAKQEAEDYFGIRFMPLRFGQDNRETKAVDEHTVLKSISSIKGFGSKVGEILYECGKKPYDSFIELLAELDRNGVKKGFYDPLIKIDYFQQFGNQRTLNIIANIWETLKHGDAKALRKEKIADDAITKIIEQYSNGKTKAGKDAASFRFHDPDSVFKFMVDVDHYICSLDLPEIDMKVMIQNYIDILGYVDIQTNKESDRRRLIILDILPMTSKDSGEVWGYRATTRSLGSGKSARVTFYSRVYDKHPVRQGDIIYCDSIAKNNKGYWYINQYHTSA